MITTQQMRRLEELSEKYGVSKLRLMENAGEAIAEIVFSRIDPRKQFVIVFCGVGNNGGDGFVAARKMSDICEVFVLVFGDEEKMAPEAAANFARLHRHASVTIIHDGMKIGDIERILLKMKPKIPILIDALLGTGVSGEIREPVKSAIMMFNKVKAWKLAVDVPSGLNPDTGESAGEICICDEIVTFHDNKPGISKFKKVIVAKIGIPEKAIKELPKVSTVSRTVVPRIKSPWKTIRVSKNKPLIKKDGGKAKDKMGEGNGGRGKDKMGEGKDKTRMGKDQRGMG